MRLLPKLVLLMTGVAAVPLGLAGLNSIRISQNITRQQVRESHLRLSESLAASVQLWRESKGGRLGRATAPASPWPKSSAGRPDAASTSAGG